MPPGCPRRRPRLRRRGPRARRRACPGSWSGVQAKTGAPSAATCGGERVVVAGRAVVGEREQDDQPHAGAQQARGAAQHRVRVAALVEVGDQDQDGLRRVVDERLAVAERLVDVGPAAELDAEQHVDRVAELLGEVDDRGVERDHAGLSVGSEASDAPSTPAWTTEAAMLPLWSSTRISSAASERRLRAVADQPLRDHRPVLGLVVAQVGPDRAVPVDLGCAAAARVRALRSSAPRAAAARAVGEPPLDVLARPGARRRRATVPARLGQRVAQAHQRRGQVHVGRDVSSTSGSSSSRCSPSRSIASCCTTRTTPLGKCARSSPSQRATRRRRRAQPALAARRTPRPAPRRSRGPRARAPRPSRRPRRRRARAATACSRSSLTSSHRSRPSRRSPARAAPRSTSIKRSR